MVAGSTGIGMSTLAAGCRDGELAGFGAGVGFGSGALTGVSRFGTGAGVGLEVGGAAVVGITRPPPPPPPPGEDEGCSTDQACAELGP